MKDYEIAARMISELDGADPCGPISETVVAQAESLLTVRLPPTYRRFLRDFGCLAIGGDEIYGIVDDDLATGPVPNGIWLTLDERKVANLAPHLVIIQDDSSGGWIALDTSRVDPEGECPVVVLTSNRGSPQQLASDFGTYLLQVMREASDA